jgi:methionine biosynthesis protein MetW
VQLTEIGSGNGDAQVTAADVVQEAVHGLVDDPALALRYHSSGSIPYESTYWLISFIKPGSRVLDIGCGTGSITKTILQERHVDIIGIEPNPIRAEAARRLGLEVITGVYSSRIPDEYGKFDYMVFADVLEHLEDPSAMLVSVADALTQHGRVIASVPNVAHWSVRLALLFGRFDYKPTGIMDATHLRWFTRKSILKLFRASGYEVEDLKHSAGAWMPHYKWTPLRLLPIRFRRMAISGLGDISYGLFACQHVISAKRTQPAP